MQTYEYLRGFEGVYLEDSWILAVSAEPEMVKFDIDVVLTESHPAYRPPRAGEQYCYRRAEIRFPEVRKLSWTGQGRVRPAVDASGSTDYGSFDNFVVEDNRYTVEGDFGRMEILSNSPELRISEEDLPGSSQEYSIAPTGRTGN